MKEAIPFVVSQFTNPSGEIVFRVYGWLDGKRVRKNFATRAEANAERDALEAERMGADTGLRRALTRLSEEQLHEAEAMFARLKEQPKPLTFYVEYALKHYNPAQREMILPDAIAEYTTFKEREQERGIISKSQVGSIKKELKLLLAHFGKVNVNEITAQQLGAFVERGKPSLKYVNNRRGLLSTFFKYAYQQDWIGANPIEKVRHYRIAHRRGSAKTMTAEQCRELMAYVENYEGGRLVPYFALCLFAGIRPCVRNGEILKLPARDVRLDTGIILIEPEVSKVRRKRTVTVQPNLAAWLQAYHARRGQPGSATTHFICVVHNGMATRVACVCRTLSRRCWRSRCANRIASEMRSSSIASSRSCGFSIEERSSSLSGVNITTRFRPREIVTYHCLASVAAAFPASANSTTSAVFPCEPYDVTA
jgi:integrase